MTRGELHEAFMMTLPVCDSGDVVRRSCFFPLGKGYVDITGIGLSGNNSPTCVGHVDMYV